MAVKEKAKSWKNYYSVILNMAKMHGMTNLMADDRKALYLGQAVQRLQYAAKNKALPKDF